MQFPSISEKGLVFGESNQISKFQIFFTDLISKPNLKIMFSLLSVMVTVVTGHGSVLYPPTRNAIDSQIVPWKGATIGPNNTEQFPQTGILLSPRTQTTTHTHTRARAHTHHRCRRRHQHHRRHHHHHHHHHHHLTLQCKTPFLVISDRAL